MMNHEYIVPMTDQTREITLYPRATGVNGGNGQPLEGIPNTSLSTSLKPQMHFSSPCFVRSEAVEGNGAFEIACTESPEIPLDILKNLTVDMLTSAIWSVDQCVRDPIGGSVELLLVPLLKMFYTLVVMGAFGYEDLGKVLRLIDPDILSINADSPEDKQNDDNYESDDDDEKEWEEDNAKDNGLPKQGLLQMKLPEAVKLEVNNSLFFFSYN